MSLVGFFWFFFVKDFSGVKEVLILTAILKRFELKCDGIRYEDRTWSAVFSGLKERMNSVSIA